MKRWLWRKRAEPSAGDSSPADEPLPSGDATSSTSDEELLRKFVIERDDQAFALLVERHSGVVMGVCRRVLGWQHDAEDAFQAVFLILARKADALRCGGSLPAWLHKTAFRTALRARADRIRRREQTTEGLEMLAPQSSAPIASEHDASIVDEELNRLPERFRLPLYLCCVEGKSLEVAARQLGWSVGSVKGRLERGRQELRQRLLRRRVPLALGFAALAMLTPSAAQAASPAVAPSLIAATVQAGMQHAVGLSSLGYVSQNALHLAQGSWKIMSLTATKILVCSVTLTGLVLIEGGRRPSPAASNGSGNGGIVIEASMPAAAPSFNFFDAQLALADEREGAPRVGAREGDQPRTGAREGDAPRTGPRDGDVPRTGAREGDAPRTGAREGAPRTGGENARTANPLNNFQPQTPREAALFQMIVQMQKELVELRQIVQARDGSVPARGNVGEGAPRTGAREGDGAPRTGPRDGEKPRTGARDGEGAPRTGPRDGEGAPRVGERDGTVPKKEGDK